MSRTDATRPMWVQVQDSTITLVVRHNHAIGPCDLALVDWRRWSLRWRSYFTGNSWHRGPMCTRAFPLPYWRAITRFGPHHVPASTRQVAEGRERCRVRDSLLVARKEWRQAGRTDVDVIPTRHRHSAAEWWAVFD